jgi:hypothetical protein
MVSIGPLQHVTQVVTGFDSSLQPEDTEMPEVSRYDVSEKWQCLDGYPVTGASRFLSLET